jgi:carbonic anhydrase
MRRWWTADRLVGRGARTERTPLGHEPLADRCAVDALVVRAAGANPPPLAGLPAAPALRLAILTCMDARIDPGALLGLAPGDAHVIRNAGGLATTEAVAALRLSQTALGTREVMVIHHTDCAALLRAGRRDPAASVRDEIERVQGAPGLRSRERVRGFVLDLGTGRMREVPRRARPRAAR